MKTYTTLFTTIVFLASLHSSFGTEEKPKRYEGFFRNIKPPIVTPMKPSPVDPTQPIEPDSSDRKLQNTLRRFPIGERVLDRYEKKFPIIRLEKDPKNYTMRLNPVPEGFRSSHGDRRNYNRPTPEENGLYIPGQGGGLVQPPVTPDRKRYFQAPPAPAPRK